MNKNVKVSVLCGDIENYERVLDFIKSVDKSGLLNNLKPLETIAISTIL